MGFRPKRGARAARKLSVETPASGRLRRKKPRGKRAQERSKEKFAEREKPKKREGAE